METWAIIGVGVVLAVGVYFLLGRGGKGGGGTIGRYHRGGSGGRGGESGPSGGRPRVE